jgi:hypothetical protein
LEFDATWPGLFHDYNNFWGPQRATFSQFVFSAKKFWHAAKAKFNKLLIEVYFELGDKELTKK